MDLGWRERGMCKVCNDAGTPGRGEKMEERSMMILRGNTDLRLKKVTTEGGREVK